MLVVLLQMGSCLLALLALALLARGNRQRLKSLHKNGGIPVPTTRSRRFTLLAVLFSPFALALWQKDWSALVILIGGLFVAGWLVALSYTVRRD